MTIDLRSIAIFAALVGLVLVATVIVASAQNAPAFPSYRPAYVWDIHEWRDHSRHRRAVIERRREVRGWHSHGHGYYPRQEYDTRCKAALAVVGDQYASEGGARGEADKAWMQTARWQHGERFMARENAESVAYECGRSSVGSVAGQVFYRCRISARPCRPQSQKGER